MRTRTLIGAGLAVALAGAMLSYQMPASAQGWAIQPLLEITAVAATRHEGPEVEGVELLALEGLGHVVGHDALSQSLDDGGLADAGLADEHRVVLGAPDSAPA